MSSAGRGPRRGGPDDCYATPQWCVDRLLYAGHPRPGWLLEPAAGDGAIIRAVNRVIGDQTWVAVESRATTAQSCRESGADPIIADFLTWSAPPHVVENVKTVITNPPFSLCEEFIRRAASVFVGADLVFLVRLGFLASEKRTALWTEVGTPNVYVLPNRPSFTGDGSTDSADYAWIVFPAFQRRTAGEFRVLPVTPLRERKRDARIAIGRAASLRRDHESARPGDDPREAKGATPSQGNSTAVANAARGGLPGTVAPTSEALK